MFFWTISKRFKMGCAVTSHESALKLKWIPQPSFAGGALKCGEVA